MGHIREVHDLRECRRLWHALWPRTNLFDLWFVRECFARRFGTTPFFLVAEEEGHPRGLLALSSLEDRPGFAAFPGESWRGETWLEQNRIPARNPAVAEDLLRHVPGVLHLRYLAEKALPPEAARFDETDYLFLPEEHGFDFDRYRERLSPRTRRQIDEETRALEARGVTFRHEDLGDLDELFAMNLRAFGEASYFRDPRFLASFEDLGQALRSARMLRVTTVLVGGRVAAVDLGGVFRRGYTLLAGGTDPEFPGVAKLINLHHIRRACGERLRFVDFLSGDFGWKERFRLTPRPLFRTDLPGGFPPEIPR